MAGGTPSNSNVPYSAQPQTMTTDMGMNPYANTYGANPGPPRNPDPSGGRGTQGPQQGQTQGGSGLQYGGPSGPVNMPSVQNMYMPAQAAPTYSVPATQTPVGVTAEFWNGLNNNGGQQAHIMNYMSMMQPWAQMQQNANQWGAEFDEQNRRFDNQFGWQQYQDQYNMGLSGRQQGLAEEQARLAAAQWAAQFGYQQQVDQFGQGLATRQQNLSELQNQQQYGLSQDQLRLQELQNQQQYGLSQRGMSLQEQQRRDQMQQFQQQYGLQQWQAQQEMGLAGRGMSLQELQNSQQYGLSQQDMALRQLQNQQAAQQFQQNFGLQQRGMSLQEAEAARQGQQFQQTFGLNSRQQGLDEAYRQAQLSQNASLQGRGMDITQQQNLAQQAYQQQQLQQQAALQREQMAQNEKLATMQAFGRAQAPQARMVRNF